NFTFVVSAGNRTNPAVSRLHRSRRRITCPQAVPQNAPNHPALWIFVSIGVALITVALVVGRGDFLRGRRDKRTRETRQSMTVPRPASPIPYHLCRTELPFSPSASRSGRRVLGSPCRLRHAPRSSPRARLRLQARRCLLSNNVLTPIRLRAS